MPPNLRKEANKQELREIKTGRGQRLKTVSVGQKRSRQLNRIIKDERDYTVKPLRMNASGKQKGVTYGL